MLSVTVTVTYWLADASNKHWYPPVQVHAIKCALVDLRIHNFVDRILQFTLLPRIREVTLYH
jgi:hypothetical protein